jgi:enoyl-CoA hydratase/carnithine racemase
MTDLLPELETLRLVLRDDGVAVMSIDRAERANSQTQAMFTEFGLVAHALRDSGARALILRGAGEKAFCAGFDLAEIDVITEMGVGEFLRFQETATGGLAAIRHLPFPVIAAVHGPAAGGGMSLALAADIAYTGRVVPADEAERIGLVNRVVPAEALFDEAFALAASISANSPGGVRMSKRALQRNQEITSYAAALELENRGQALLTRSEDMPEALEALRQRRPPTFTGR